MSLDTNMFLIHPLFKIRDGKMDQCIALLEEILVMTKANESDCFFNTTTCVSEKAYVREAYKNGDVALFQLKNMGHMIPKLYEVANITCSFKVLLRISNPLRKYYQASITTKQYLNSDITSYLLSIAKGF